MRAQTILAPYVCGRMDVDAPQPTDLGAGQVLLRVLAAGLCGSDLPAFRDGALATTPAPATAVSTGTAGSIGTAAHTGPIPGYPLHEVAGEVIASRDDALPTGARVVGWTSGRNAAAEVIVAEGAGLHPYDETLAATEAIVLQPLEVDVVLLAVGVRPTTGWLAGSGLTVDNGVLCDETCLAAPGIVAAGDVAVWPHRRTGEVRRVEHWDNAIRQGRHAARRLLADDDPAGHQPYEPVPWVWSDQFGCKLQVLGSPAVHDEFRILSGAPGDRRFAGAYRRDDRLVGVVALNSPRSVVAARPLLAGGASWLQALQALDARTPVGTASTQGRHPT